MVSLERIRKELFIQEAKLTRTLDLGLIGRATVTNDVFYNENDAGYCIYLPKVEKDTRALFDPISPTGFRWSIFNKKMIFIPNDNMEFKKFYRIHPNMNEYIIRFNLDYYTRYKKCWIESENPKNDYYFLISAIPKNISWTNDVVETEEKENEETIYGITNKKPLFHEGRNDFFIDVVPEFLHMNQIYIPITDNNTDEIWRHWLCRDVTGWHTDEFKKHYTEKGAWSDTEWIDSVITTLTFKNLVEQNPEPVLDPELKRLLGLI